MAKTNYNLESIFREKDTKYWSTLKKTSKGGRTGKEYLCENNTEEVFNIEKYIDDNYEKYNFENLPARVDAIYFKKQTERIFFIEFKISTNINSQEIKNKMVSSYDIFKKIIGNTKIDDKYIFLFCLILPPYTSQQKLRRPKKMEIQYGLEYINNDKCKGFFNEIFTLPVNLYKKVLKP